MKEYITKIVVAEPNWCVPATIEMVLLHHGIGNFTQQDVARQLNIVPASDRVKHSLWGAQIREGTINSFFLENGIPLREEYISVSHFFDEYDMVCQIEHLLSHEYSVICGFNYTWLYGSREDTFRHVSIITDILSNGDKVCLLDPGPRAAGYHVVKSDDLFSAVKAAGDGLWCICSRTL